jgi:hypothetical protein
MILGDSGSGKTRSLKHLDPKETILIQPIKKPLPFKGKGWDQFDMATKTGSVLRTDDYNLIKAICVNAHKKGIKQVIIDDAQYIMLNESLRRVEETGFKKFVDFAKNYVDLITTIANCESALVVYFMTHTEESESGKITAKTVGKMISQQVCLEGLFSIVLRCHASDGRHFFTTKTSGMDCVKTPEDMFASDQIENDLSPVTNLICEYYGIS